METDMLSNIEVSLCKCIKATYNKAYVYLLTMSEYSHTIFKQK